MRRVAVLSICLGLAACGDSAVPPRTAVAPQLKPEMLVRTKPGVQFACRTEEDFAKVLGHSANGERSKFAAMFQDFTCIQFPEGEQYRLLSVKGTMVEFTHASNTTAAEGMWTDVSTFDPDAQ